MKWNQKDYPLPMRSLNNNVRIKAIEIGNLLMKYGYKKEEIVPIAIHKAKEEINHSGYSF